MVGLGHVLFAASFAGLGVLSLMSGDFALDWQPVPASVPWRTHLAHASGFILLTSGIGMFFERTARNSACILVANVAIWLFLLQLPRVIAHPTNPAAWLGFAETLVMVVGGWIILDSVNGPGKVAGIRIAQRLFAAALPLIGLSHFVYVEITTALVPAWLPNRVAFAYFTGAAHVAAGFAVLIGFIPRVAAALEACMIASFTLLVWVPRVAASPASRMPWTALLVSSALAAAAWAVAQSIERNNKSDEDSNRKEKRHEVPVFVPNAEAGNE